MMTRIRSNATASRHVALLILLFGMFLSMPLIALHLGYIKLSVPEIAKTLIGFGSSKDAFILYQLRLPRILLALLAGVGFAISGAIMQGVSQNALADPGILGINAGAGCAVVLYVSVYYDKIALAPAYALPMFAFVGAFAAAILVYLLSLREGVMDPMRLVLSGVAVGAGIGAAMLFATYYMGSYQYEFIKIWMTGSIWGTNWGYVKIVCVWLAVLIPIAIYKSRILNVLQLGDLIATGVGSSVQKERLILITVAVAAAAACVSAAGSIGFVGLIAPHIARRMFGASYKLLLPAAALIGGIMVAAADMLGRHVAPPVEIPVGVVVAAVGAPYFLYLLMKRR